MKTLIIAEAGVNHNGDMAMARELIAQAAQAGADLVKFQTFSAQQLVTQSAPKADYQMRRTGTSQSQAQMLAQLELSRQDHEMLMAECKRCGIGFFSTAFDAPSFDLLCELGGLPMVKIPSGELTNLPLLRYMTRLNKPVLLSTGMATLGEVEAAIDAIEAGPTSRSNITVLHCTTEYPAPMAEVNLHAMAAMRQALGVRVGYSDHTAGFEVAVAAVALGACVIEKHFTLDRRLPGPDHLASLEPQELAAMVRAIRHVELALGDGIKRPSASELKNKAIARKSIVAKQPIAAGELLSAENLAVKRPGTGLSPMRWDEVLGRVAVRDFGTDEMIEL